VTGPFARHDRETGGGECYRWRVTKRTASTGHDRHRCAHGVTRPKSAAARCLPSRSRLFRVVNSSFSSHRCSEVVAWRLLVLPDHAIGGHGCWAPEGISWEARKVAPVK